VNYMKEIELPLTEVRLSFFMENFYDHSRPTWVDDKFVFQIPIADKRIPLFSVEDTGGIVVPIFNNPQEWIGKWIGVAGDYLTGKQIAKIFEKYVGMKTDYIPMSMDDYKFEERPHAETSALFYKYFCDVGEKFRDVKKTRELYPKTQNFDTWMQRHVKEFL
jgi:hypothetical protein